MFVAVHIDHNNICFNQKKDLDTFAYYVDSLAKKAYIKGQVDYKFGDVRIDEDTVNNRWILTQDPYSPTKMEMFSLKQ